MRPQHFDLTVTDVTNARCFFESVFGWRFARFDMPYEYYRIQTGGPDEPGIDGGIGAVRDAPLTAGRPLVTLTMPVPSLDECIAGIQANGGRVVEPRTAIPGIGWYATCAEPGGLMFGIIESDLSVA